MAGPHDSRGDDVEQLLRNAQLRNELEPFMDEAIERLNISTLPLREENEFLESMLAWERAPALPIAQWFDPELRLAHPRALTDEQIAEMLWDTVLKLYDKRIVLEFTDHLSDRQLYALIYRDILPSYEKKLQAQGHFLHWDCADADGESENWLKYYATDEEREAWESFAGKKLPPREAPPHPRKLPGASFY